MLKTFPNLLDFTIKLFVNFFITNRSHASQNIIMFSISIINEKYLITFQSILINVLFSNKYIMKVLKIIFFLSLFKCFSLIKKNPKSGILMSENGISLY